MATFEFYRKPVAGLRTKQDVLNALTDALEEVQEAIKENRLPAAELAEAMTFLKRYYERLERLILSEGMVDYKKLIRLQQEDPLLQQAKRRFDRQQARIGKGLTA